MLVPRVLCCAAVVSLSFAACGDDATPCPDGAGRCADLCVDGLRNGDESDVDCGGSCEPCALGRECTATEDCAAGMCFDGACADSSCGNGVQDGDETDVDCGADSCGPCDDGRQCAEGLDCHSRVCSGGRCAAPACTDGVMNGSESDLDCGTEECGPCADGSLCREALDCVSGICTGDRCAAPSCTDGALNQDESDIDCGGSCAPCEIGARCIVGRDCVSSVCQDDLCVPSSCGDLVQNADETDIDCGGTCGGCEPGEGCLDATDCHSLICEGATCATPACDDGITNGDESDLDCGGSCAPCDDGTSCGAATDCASGVCDDAMQCAAPRCDDDVGNGDESDVDCGGSCAPCVDGASCGGSVDCLSRVCGDLGLCAAPSCSDGVANGTETATDCGGACAGCADGVTCGLGSDCQSGVCGATMTCATPTCTDGVANGSEPDVDCGGLCMACGDGRGCSVGGDCASGVCTAMTCAVPTCSDGVVNGTETDLDCGGSCAGCPVGSGCIAAADCATTYCRSMECVAGPTAAFTVSPTSGTAPLSVRVTGSATPGSAAIASVRYNFGVGAGLETDAVHTYTSSGMFTITQRVVDTNGIVATTTRSVMVDPATFTPVRLSTTDRSPSPAMELTADRLGMEVITGSPAGVRSDRAIMPGSGMFYYEGERLTSLVGQMRFGVATAAVPLGSQLGATTQSVSVETVGSVYYDGAFVESFPASVNQDYGIVVDYRGTHPIVHVIVRATNPATFAIEDRVHASVTMSAVTAPLYIMLSGGRRRVGPQARINPGNDTTNFPFHYNVVTLLNRAGLAGSALVRGWGQTQARPANDAPIISTSADRTVPVGTPVTVTATATDAEDGTLTPSIAWQDLASIYGSRVTGAGGSFTVTPTTVGIHPLEARVTDATGQTTIQVVDVTVTGAIPQFDPVRLVPDSRSGPGILLSADGLSARFTGVGKYGIRANQGMRGAFQYFETRRLIAPGNQGSGLVVGDGHLDPYDAITVPPSVSINHGNGVWRSIIYEDDYDVAATTYYGFAVDYRGRHPIVYVIARDGVSASDVVAHRFVLDDVTTPIYPMAYGNPISPSGFDTRINFGATAFNYDPAAVLGTAGYSAAGLELGWGDANTP